MAGAFTTGPVLWYVNRSTGLVLVVLLTISTALGVFSTARTRSARWPRFATQALHRNIALLALAMLGAHVASAVVDGYVDIRWYDAVLPFGGRYEPVWLGLGAAAFDLVVAIVVTSLVRHRLNLRGWRAVHLLSYAAWALGVVHGIGIGTDAATIWGLAVSALSVVVVAGFGVLRLATAAHERRLTA